jgi:prepilin-type N-terminal cleavage/methylation domain-containing protein
MKFNNLFVNRCSSFRKGVRAQRGYTLIEALVALLVLSIGLGGMAALHLATLSSAHSSYYRSIASTVALDLEERIWEFAALNFQEPGDCVTDAEFQNLRAQLVTRWSFVPGESAAGQAGIPNLNITFGNFEIREDTRLQDGLPGVWRDRWVQVPVRLTWTERRFAGDNTPTEQFDYVVRMPCVPEYN